MYSFLFQILKNQLNKLTIFEQILNATIILEFKTPPQPYGSYKLTLKKSSRIMMLLITLSTLSLTLFLLLSSVVGWFIGSFLQKKQGAGLENKLAELETERSDLMNELKKEKKQGNRVKQQKDTWQNKFEEAEKKYIPLTERSKKEIENLNTRIMEAENGRHKMKTELDRKVARVDQLEKEYEKLKLRYDTDLSDSKGWKNKRDTLLREVKEYRAKFERTEKEAEQLRERLSNQSKSIKEAQKFQSDFRKLKAAKQKLENDIEYWEKKHYDTHHELAATMKKLEDGTAKNKELDLFMKGQEIKEQNMMKKLEEFKTKFVNVNNQYHELLNKTKAEPRA